MSLVHLETKDPQETLDHQEHQDLKETPVDQVSSGVQDKEDAKGIWVIRGTLVHKA